MRLGLLKAENTQGVEERKKSSSILSGEVQQEKFQRLKNVKPGKCAWADCVEPGSNHCGRCRKSFYCCTAHQAKDWDVFHRFVCTEEAIPITDEETVPLTTSSASPVSVETGSPSASSVTSASPPKVDKQTVIEKRATSSAKKKSGFDPMTSVHPTSVGPNGVPPQDIWDASNSPSICLDLKQVLNIGVFCFLSFSNQIQIDMI